MDPFLTSGFHQKLFMGPNPNGPRSVSKLRAGAIRYSGFCCVRSFVGPTVGDFLDGWDEHHPVAIRNRSFFFQNLGYLQSFALLLGEQPKFKMLAAYFF